MKQSILGWVFLPFFLLLTGGKEKSSPVEKIAGDYVYKNPNSGIAIAVVTADTSYIETQGFADNLRKVDENSVFEIASLTKLFTAIALGEEIARNNINPLSSITQDLPALSCDSQLTWKNVATHSSGLPRLATNFWTNAIDSQDPYASYNQSCMDTFISSYAVPPSKKGFYEYSNVGYGLLGEALKKKSGDKSYYEYIRKMVLSPIGMENTYINDREDKNAAAGFVRGKKVKNWNFSEPTQGHGALRSSISDMQKFLFASLFPDKTPISNGIEITQKEWFKDPLNGTTTGLGWHIGNYAGKKIYVHAGATAGFRSVIIVSPDTKTGIVILANSDQNVEKSAYELFNVLLKEKKKHTI